MKYNHLYFCLLFLVCVEVYAQENVLLKTVPFEVKDQSIYIEEVIDNRKEKQLGHLKDPDGHKVCLKLHGGASKAVQEFADASFPHLENKRPIYLKINALNVQESKRRMNNGIVGIARAHVALVFFEKNTGEMNELFSIKHNEDQVFALIDRENLFHTHEQRIRAALEYCMLAFVDHYQKDSKETKPTHFPEEGPAPGFNSKLGKWFNLITVKAMNSTYHEGWSVGYTGFVDSKKGFILPYEISYEHENVKSNSARDRGYESADLRIIRPRFYYLYKKLIPGIYAALSLSTPLGYEELENIAGDDSSNFIIGVGASQGIRIIPWENFGIVIGADFLQQFQTSEVYRRDLGFELILGVNF
ncbi:MAG: hypothetical protein MI921_09545 [Cytophagales bacterium]|nr:hypothetical protein [Cytophagales bacterium]